MSMIRYDYLIIGTGPSGLTFATLCALNGKRVLLIERDISIGGCHRVNRILAKESNELLFSEHGPRIYSSSFLNFKQILELMNLRFEDLFIAYKFNSVEFARKTIFEILSIRESLILFSNVLINLQKKNITLKDFMEKYKFSEISKEYMDGVCRITDGAGYDKYTLQQFIELINQQSLYGMYQPKMPLDRSLFKNWYNFLIETKMVDIKLSTIINNCIIDENNNISLLRDNDNNIYYGDKIILACPPLSIKSILLKWNILDAFGDINIFENFAKETAYYDYIPIVFHWKEKLILPDIWNFPPVSEWGILYTVLTDYMYFEEKSSKTVISTMITRPDRISSFLKKSVNECSKDELIKETLRQLREIISLPEPSVSIISPNIYREGDVWKNNDTAYFNIGDKNEKYEKSYKYKNLYTIGTHNSNSSYYFTSFESAVSNAIVAFNKLNDKADIKLNIKKPIEILSLIHYFIIIIICYVFYICTKKIIKYNKLIKSDFIQ